MNNKRRDLLKRAASLLEDAHSVVNRVLEEEQDCMDNTPENLQASERYEKIEAAIDSLEAAIESIDSAKESIEDASV